MLNKLIVDVKDPLQNLIEEAVNCKAVDVLTTVQKLKLLQLSLHYVMPKLHSTEMTEKQQGEPIFIGVFERKDGEQEAENWYENFEVTSRKKLH